MCFLLFTFLCLKVSVTGSGRECVSVLLTSAVTTSELSRKVVFLCDDSVSVFTGDDTLVEFRVL